MTCCKVAPCIDREYWRRRLAQAKALKAAGKKEITRIEKEIERLVDRIVDSGSPTAIKAYEARIAKLEKEKHLTAEKLETGTQPARPFEEMFELALAFLANPSKLWASERLEDKRTVLKLAFSERLAYQRNTGFRTPKTALPFKLLDNVRMRNCEMARPGGFEPPAFWSVARRSIQLSYERNLHFLFKHVAKKIAISGREIT